MGFADFYSLAASTLERRAGRPALARPFRIPTAHRQRFDQPDELSACNYLASMSGMKRMFGTPRSHSANQFGARSVRRQPLPAASGIEGARKQEAPDSHLTSDCPLVHRSAGWFPRSFGSRCDAVTPRTTPRRLTAFSHRTDFIRCARASLFEDAYVAQVR